MAASSVSGAPARVNGTTTKSAAVEDEDLYTQLLRLQDVVLAGGHTQFRLAPDVIEELKAALILPESAANNAARATNHTSSTAAQTNGLPSLGAHTTLDPIFLEKSDSLVRAESQLKRQRLERDLQPQHEPRRQARFGRDTESDSASLIAVDEVLRVAQERVRPLSGLKPAKANSRSPFDENDYYSSRAPSDWSPSAHSSNGSDRGADAFTAGFERLDGARTTLAESSVSAQNRKVHAAAFSNAHKALPPTRVYNAKTVHDLGDEDEEYTPPDAAAFDNATHAAADMSADHETLDDEMSDYEPGEITQHSTMAVPYHTSQQAVQPSPRVPIIRNNHLTHIAAPQPNRVSPLATAKGPSIELELVNGRPEIVQKSQPKPQQQAREGRYPLRSRISRLSTASPSEPGGNNRKKRNKKRKHEPEPSNRVKKRRDRGIRHFPPSPEQPYIKDEPVSPPPFADAPAAPQYHVPIQRPEPPPAQMVSPREGPPPRYVHDPQPSGLRYEYARPVSPAVVRVASRVGPYLAGPSTYPEPRPVQYLQQNGASNPSSYPDMAAESHLQYVRTERAPSPPEMQEYQNQYTRAPSPVAAVPPPPRRIMVDQYGNRFYAADPAPTFTRASVAPVERQPEPQPVYERAPSRMSMAHAPALVPRYEPIDTRMAPPPTPMRRQEQSVEYVDANGYRVQEFTSRPVGISRYAQAPTSPVYQQAPQHQQMAPPAPPGPAERTSPVYQSMPRYEAMPPPSAPPYREPASPVYQQVPRAYSTRPQEPTSPVYQQMPRAYSIRPQEPSTSAMSYSRQASAAPVQSVRQDMAPPPPPPVYRAMSVAPGAELRHGQQQEYHVPNQQPAYGYAPQAVRYVDQYGREVDPQQLRQGSVARY
ncbi:hypothetical protein LTR91_008578 [Friedmanniomyces endolithicus]|uniref:Uncharacterized protein n=1 Tax=Friedmanniomyces endolithicus TaxID=329885 RepID=A0AAN6FSR2_9PEZI|nr:hypothetical protein LTS09_014085 [Friedmanniomyces endolithicus]KAK0270033.1 hypothetical protein LTS00_017095 [Friedmanniomyces endolithicus]KAK0288119.1 hypothetical protein LTR35_003593 [Friedmanniomyces endolithicus]KAK0312038.1 hypothetical protein LTR01_002952 [Friedmanniomyces endolithicus]KAK0321652.1 hypothetical protein LTR82_007138 [Friedmanniomyces endolithicus]